MQATCAPASYTQATHVSRDNVLTMELQPTQGVSEFQFVRITGGMKLTKGGVKDRENTGKENG